MRKTIPTTHDHRSDEWPDSGVRRGPVICKRAGCGQTTGQGKPFCARHVLEIPYAASVAARMEAEKRREGKRVADKRYRRKVAEVLRSSRRAPAVMFGDVPFNEAGTAKSGNGAPEAANDEGRPSTRRAASCLEGLRWRARLGPW